MADQEHPTSRHSICRFDIMEDQKSISELKKEAEGLREEISRLKFDLSLNKLKDTNMIKKKRKNLARVLTKIRQLEIINA